MLNVGVIGCGGMGRDHIKRITERTQGAQVVAVSDVFEEGAKKAAEIAGGAKVYTNGKDLINDPEVDAVLIVSPGFAHVDDLLEAIKVGKRVFCEKPLCTTADDCKKVMEAEEAKRKASDPVGIHETLPQRLQPDQRCDCNRRIWRTADDALHTP